MKSGVELLIIDPQVDFVVDGKALYVKGAEENKKNLKELIMKKGGDIDDIHCTLDKHHRVDVAHPIFWKDSKGQHPAPFAIITEDDLLKGRFTTTNPGWFSQAKEYVAKLAKSGRFPLCVWPEHCLIGSNGSSVDPDIFEALCHWEQQFAWVDYVTKGTNMFTEHYSAVEAEVPDDNDETTQLNVLLIETIARAKQIGLAGWASSHCLRETVIDIADNFGEDNIKKMVLLTDATNAVTGFEKQAEDFVNSMTARGMRLAETSQFPL